MLRLWYPSLRLLELGARTRRSSCCGCGCSGHRGTRAPAAAGQAEFGGGPQGCEWDGAWWTTRPASRVELEARRQAGFLVEVACWIGWGWIERVSRSIDREQLRIRDVQPVSGERSTSSRSSSGRGPSCCGRNQTSGGRQGWLASAVPHGPTKDDVEKRSTASACERERVVGKRRRWQRGRVRHISN